MIHMTATEQVPGGGYLWRCRCGKQQDGFVDVMLARKAGDAHLAAAHPLEDEPVSRRITPTGHATPRELWPDSREAARDEYDR